MSQACRSLGASVTEISLEPLAEEALDRAVRAAAEERRIDLLVVDSAGIYSSALIDESDGLSALRACMDSSWNATRAAVNVAFLEQGQGGRIVYLAPVADAGPRAGAARAGLENLARTTSVEWARHQITAVTITAGRRSSADEVATLVAYLASPAGAYFSGCRLDLDGN